MRTWDFAPSYSDVVVNDQAFTISDTDTTPLVAAYIFVGTGGNLVWENNKGEPQWAPGLVTGGYYKIGAKRILGAATVRGVSRSTTATGCVWFAVNKLYDTP